jgi:arginyl-tRNA synthetase
MPARDLAFLSLFAPAARRSALVSASRHVSIARQSGSHPVNLARRCRAAMSATDAAAASVSPPSTSSDYAQLEPKLVLAHKVSAAILAAYPNAPTDDPKLAASKVGIHGDFQANAALSLSKLLKLKPRDVAMAIVANLGDLSAICEPPVIAGPGFINFTLSDEFVCGKLSAIRADKERLGLPVRTSPQKIIVDFSSPNIAKDMHAGHLRSTIIGDTIARTLTFLGHDVVRLNHTGDWGTQFGQLITHMRDVRPELLAEGEDGGDGVAGSADVAIGDLVEFYKAAKARFDQDPEFKARAQAEVVELQSGNEKTLKAWRIICDLSRKEFQKIYDRLNIELTERGESFYNKYLPGIVEQLTEKSLAVNDQGAVVVFLEGERYVNRDGSRQPLIVKKSDGGYLYATTDLAAIQYRCMKDKADRILYVTDVGQSLHFEQVYQVARRAGLAGDSVSLEHIPFGLVLGEDGKKFKTRSGDTVKLVDLLDEAALRVRAELTTRFEADCQKAAENGTEPPAIRSEDDLARQAEHIGMAAVKYADLKTNRTSNYKFSYDKMVSLDGDTAPYIMYAYARVQGIYRTAQLASGIRASAPIKFVLERDQERALAKLLLQLPEILTNMEHDLMPHVMCEYIKTVTAKFNQFYEECPVVRAETSELQASRLAICGICADTLKLCLGLLGIPTLDRI